MILQVPSLSTVLQWTREALAMDPRSYLCDLVHYLRSFAFSLYRHEAIGNIRRTCFLSMSFSLLVTPREELLLPSPLRTFTLVTKQRCV